MTVKTAQELLPLLNAFIEGKTIQYSISVSPSDWKDTKDPQFGTGLKYRIKPEPKTASLTIEDLYEHFRKGTIFTKVNSKKHFLRISSLSIQDKAIITPLSFSSIDVSEFLKAFLFEDGSPLTKIIEE